MTEPPPSEVPPTPHPGPAPAPAVPEVPNRTFRFDGPTGSFFKLYLKNIVLTLLTLGIYRFWAKVEVTKFLYRHTSFYGGRFGYHATGKEKFFGFLRGMLILLPVVGLLVILYRAVEPHVGGENAFIICLYGFGFVMALLRPLIIVGTRAFNYARTSWNNLRFRFKGRVKPLYRIYLRDYVLMVITFGIYTAWHHVNVKRYIRQHTEFGGNKLDYDGSGGDLFAIYFFGLLLSYITLGIFLPWYIAGIHRYHIDHTLFQSQRFKSRLRGSQMFSFLLVSVLTVILTVGLALPWVIIRYNRMIAETTDFLGVIDLGAIRAGFDAQATATLEGIGEAGEALESLGELFGG